MLPSVAKSGWLPDGLPRRTARSGIALLAPEQLFGLAGLDNLTHSLFWSLLANVGALRRPVALARSPSAREASQALLFVDVFERRRRRRRRSSGAAAPGSTTCRRSPAASSAPPARGALFDEHARETGVAGRRPRRRRPPRRPVERQLAGAIGSASARVMVASVVAGGAARASTT